MRCSAKKRGRAIRADHESKLTGFGSTAFFSSMCCLSCCFENTRKGGSAELLNRQLSNYIWFPTSNELLSSQFDKCKKEKTAVSPPVPKYVPINESHKSFIGYKTPAYSSNMIDTRSDASNYAQLHALDSKIGN